MENQNELTDKELTQEDINEIQKETENIEKFKMPVWVPVITILGFVGTFAIACILPLASHLASSVGDSIDVSVAAMITPSVCFVTGIIALVMSCKGNFIWSVIGLVTYIVFMIVVGVVNIFALVGFAAAVVYVTKYRQSLKEDK